MGTQTVRVAQGFAEPIERVFAALADHNRLSTVFVLPVTRIHDGGSDVNGVGAVRRIGPWPFGVQETVTEFIPDSSIRYRITRFAGPIRNHTGRIGIEQDGTGCRATWSIDFDTVPAAAGPPVQRLLQASVTAGLKRLARRLSQGDSNAMASTLAKTPPGSLEALIGLDRKTLERLHAEGYCPEPTAFRGALDGVVLTTPVVRLLRLWRGKVFDQAHDGIVSGKNRLGIGSVERRRYRFSARPATSAFSDRQVLFLDHDLPGNPDWVRRFHDELVEIAPGLYLAKSHLRVGGGLRYLCHFALAAGQGQ